MTKKAWLEQPGVLSRRITYHTERLRRLRREADAVASRWGEGSCVRGSEAPYVRMLERIETFRFEAGGMERRITNFEMESAPLAGLCALLGHNACTVCCAIANRYLQSSNPDYKPFIRRLAEIAVDRMATL